MKASTPPCPLCGHTTTLHCQSGTCDWYECLACDLVGIIGHPGYRSRGTPKGNT